MTMDTSNPATGGVVAGFFSFTEVTDPRAHFAYNALHQLDHLPEQMPLAGVAHGERWVVSPRCLACRDFGRGDLADAHYLTLYLMRPPIDETIESFYELAMRLHDEDRFFPHRRSIAAGALPVEGALAAQRVRISAAALPYRLNRGVYAVVEHRPAVVSDDGRRAVTVEQLGDLLRIPGVAGAWRFGRQPGTGDGGEEADVPAPRGSARTLDASVTVVYLDDDPVSVSDPIRELLMPRWEREEIAPAIAGPLEAITPWSWDWFDDEQSRATTEEGDK
jgi:hypothetical protein